MVVEEELIFYYPQVELMELWISIFQLVLCIYGVVGKDKSFTRT